MIDRDRFSDEYDPEPDYERPTRAEAEAELRAEHPYYAARPEKPAPSGVEQYRRRVLSMTTGREVADYRYALECGHVVGGETGMTHKQAQRRKTLICQDCRRNGEAF